MNNQSVRLAMIAEVLAVVDASDANEVGAVIDAACDGIREIVAELAAGEQAELEAALEAALAGPLVSPDIDEAECLAVVRFNSIDGHLYACGYPRSDPVHGSIEACEALSGYPCERAVEHHEFVSTTAASAAVPA